MSLRVGDFFKGFKVVKVIKVFRVFRDFFGVQVLITSVANKYWLL